MKPTIAALLGCALMPCVAYAADKPLIAPAPAWVKPVALPVDKAAADEAPVRLLLSDQQVSLNRDGQTTYSEIAYRIQTPQGLPAGNVAFAWRPETDTLTVHKLLIRRDAQVTDVLAAGQTFTVVRRETNLESATLDGVLTATLQPEGLQVGDIVDFAASITSSDPVLKGHVELLGGAWNDFPVARAHLRIVWPTAIPARLRTTASLPALKPVKTGATTGVELSLDALAPVVPPKGAPVRYRMGRLVELTDYASWADLAALMAPLYEKAATLPADGPLRTEFDRIRTASTDPRARTEAALALVQDRVRYVALAMGAGGLVPADAATTWSRRFGDCKGKTALLIALLRALDIEAEPVLVNSVAGDGLDQRLPIIGLFDHVLVRATIAGKDYWLDGTRTGDTALDRLQIPNFGWGLPVRASGATLVRMLPAPLDTPGRDTTIRIDARAGLTTPAPTTVETVIRGDDAIGLKASLANLIGTARDTALREYWKGQHDFIDIKSVAATFDAKTGEQRLTMTGNAKMDWTGGNYETDGTHVGYRADFARESGPGRDAPFAVAYPYFVRIRETILLPRGVGAFRIGKATEVDQTIAGVAYRRHATIADDTYAIEKTERSLAPDFPAADAAPAQAALRALSEKSARIEKPAGYASTDADIAAAQATEPTDSAGYVSRASIFIDRGMRMEALRDYDRAAALDPTNVYAWSNRAITRVQVGDLMGARADIAKADTIDPRFGQTFIARGMLADAEYRPADAITAYTAALNSDPGNGYALSQRSAAYAMLGDADHAIADLTARITAKPDDVSRLLARAGYQATMGRRAAADADYARALAIAPDAATYLARARHRIADDVAGRQADIDAALRLDAKDSAALAALAELEADRGNLAVAITAYTRLLVTQPTNASLLIARGVALARSGDAARAERDFAVVRAGPDRATTDNEACWDKATANVLLDSALRDCDAALARVPDNPQWRDSRGLVLLRLGRTDAAIADYDAALARNPYQPTSLFGRGVAYARTGDAARAKADMAAAEKITATVRGDFARWGVTP